MAVHPASDIDNRKRVRLDLHDPLLNPSRTVISA